MYCPNCGLATSTEQKFCRSCELSLEKAAHSLVEQLPAVELNPHVRERQRRVERLLYMLGGSAAVIFVVSLCWTVINEIIIAKVTSLEAKGFIISGMSEENTQNIPGANGRSLEGFSVSCPGLPGCWSQGKTEEEALENIQDAIRQYLAAVDDLVKGQDVREVQVPV